MIWKHSWYLFGPCIPLVLLALGFVFPGRGWDVPVPPPQEVTGTPGTPVEPGWWQRACDTSPSARNSAGLFFTCTSKSVFILCTFSGEVP